MAHPASNAAPPRPAASVREQRRRRRRAEAPLDLPPDAGGCLARAQCRLEGRPGRTPVSAMRRFWGLMRAYWLSERWPEAWSLTAVIILLTALSAMASVWFAEASGRLMSAIAFLHSPQNPTTPHGLSSPAPERCSRSSCSRTSASSRSGTSSPRPCIAGGARGSTGASTTALLDEQPYAFPSAARRRRGPFPPERP